MLYIIALLNSQQLIKLLCSLKAFIFKQYIQNKNKQYSITNYKPCDSNGHTYNMTLYFSNDRKNMTLSMTPTPANVTRLNARLENVGHSTNGKLLPISSVTL
jgi:hypothetical protein